MPKVEHIIGHVLEQEQLQSDLEQKNVSHAYLFSGPRHIGKRSLAFKFASELLTKNVPEEKREAVLHSIENLTHSDLFVLDMLWTDGTNDDWNVLAKHSNVPQIHRSKSKSKTDTIGIDDVRALQERLHETGSGTYRCCIITSMERMQAEAANAFLKLLEEPPEGLVFLLTTQAQNALLPTIISRARTMAFRRVSPKDMHTLLSGVPDDDKTFMLHIASGAPGMVIRLRDDPDFLRLHKAVHSEALSFWSSGSTTERMKMLKPLHKRTIEADDLLLHLGLTLREQKEGIDPKNAMAYQRLVADLHTNAHRQLLTQRFALELSAV